jgi:hypothetical protein
LSKTKGNKFAFGPLETAEELRPTMMSPATSKNTFPKRNIIHYDLSDGFSTKEPDETKPMVIIGVHPYDIVALLHMDEISENKIRPFLLKKREQSIIIGVNIQRMSKWNFSSFMGTSRLIMATILC